MCFFVMYFLHYCRKYIIKKTLSTPCLSSYGE